jgi:hypothetical protein
VVDIGLDHLSRESPIRQDRVEIPHEFFLGHRRDRLEIRFGRLIRVDPGEPPAVPWRAVFGLAKQHAQLLLSLRAQSFRRPPNAFDVLLRERAILLGVS